MARIYMTPSECAAVRTLREKGFAVAVFYPDEFARADISAQELQDCMVEQGNMAIEVHSPKPVGDA